MQEENENNKTYQGKKRTRKLHEVKCRTDKKYNKNDQAKKRSQERITSDKTERN